MSRHNRMALARLIAPLALLIVATAVLAVPAHSSFAQSRSEQLAMQLLQPAIPTMEARHAPVQAAAVALLNNDARLALQNLERAAEADERLAPPDAMLARLLLLSGNGDAARQAIEAAAQKHPTDPEPVLLAGQIAFQTQQPTVGEACFRRGLELCDSYTTNDYRKENLQSLAFSGLTAIAINRKQWDLALQYAQAWNELKPDDVQALNALARATFEQGDQASREQAYRYLNDAYEIDSTQPRPEISMAQLYATAGEQRRNLVNLAIERDPNTLATRLAACRWALDAGELTFAQENAQAAMALDRNSAEALALSGAVARVQGNFAAAERALLEAHAISPASIDITNLLALVLAEQSDADKQNQAVQYAQANVERLQQGFPSQPAARETAMTLAWCQYKAGNRENALRIAAQIADQGPGAVSGDAAYHLAYILFENNNSRFAREVLVAALANPTPFFMRSEAEALLAKIPPSP